jgi:hypothetical protein
MASWDVPNGMEEVDKTENYGTQVAGMWHNFKRPFYE